MMRLEAIPRNKLKAGLAIVLAGLAVGIGLMFVWGAFLARPDSIIGKIFSVLIEIVPVSWSI